MKKYNLSKIMKKAWETFKLRKRTRKVSFSDCLKESWSAAKASVKMESATTLKMCVSRNDTFTVDTATGIISGKTFSAKEWIKRNFDAKWDSSNKVWKTGIESLRSELVNNASYYEKYIVSESIVEEIKSTVKTIISEELVNHWDGFYNHVVYSDGTRKCVFVG